MYKAKALVGARWRCKQCIIHPDKDCAVGTCSLPWFTEYCTCFGCPRRRLHEGSSEGTPPSHDPFMFSDLVMSVTSAQVGVTSHLGSCMHRSEAWLWCHAGMDVWEGETEIYNKGSKAHCPPLQLTPAAVDVNIYMWGYMYRSSKNHLSIFLCICILLHSTLAQ
jgi:hypothetical protein